MFRCWRTLSITGAWLVVAAYAGPATAASTAPAPARSAATADAPSIATVLARVQALQARNPAAALQAGLQAWQAGPPQGARIELGLHLIAAADALRQPAQAVAIGARLLPAALTPTQRLRLLWHLCESMWATRDLARVRALEPQITTLRSQLPGQAQAIAELWRKLSSSYLMLDDTRDALRTARIALATAPRHPSMVDYWANQLIAVVYVKSDELPKAIAALQAADRAGKALGLPDRVSLMLNFNALYMYAKNWPKAIEYGQRAMAAGPDPAQQVAILANVGGAYQELGDFPRAGATYAHALRIARAHQLPAPSLLNNMADLLQKQNQPAQALPLLQQAAREFERAGSTSEAATAYSNIGAALAGLDQHAAAERAYAKSLALFTAADDVQRRLELYPRMVDNLVALGRYRDALSVMRAYKKLHDVHVTVQSNTQMAKLEAVIELERRNAELAQAQREHDRQQAALVRAKALEQRQLLTTEAMLAALLLLAAVAALSIRQSRVRKCLNQSLAMKNAEIETQYRDLTRLHDTISRQSEEDALTGLRNRRYGQAWLERLAAAHLEARRKGSPLMPALVMLLDIDHFKKVNDRHGHEAGDHALKHFAGILRECSRQADILVRWGGEEFLWACPGTPISEAQHLFARVRERLQQTPLILRGDRVSLTVSMGFSLFPLWPEATGDWAFCLRMADTALYRAKTSGRDRWTGLIAGKLAQAMDHERCAREASVDELEARGCLTALAEAV
jgi:diguanylate cyclase (GGDEF)-like protein